MPQRPSSRLAAFLPPSTSCYLPQQSPRPTCRGSGLQPSLPPRVGWHWLQRPCRSEAAGIGEMGQRLLDQGGGTKLLG
jgi:hypothetical protein